MYKQYKYLILQQLTEVFNSIKILIDEGFIRKDLQR